MDNEQEIWVEISGFPNYQVSSLGRIKSLQRRITRKNGVTITLRESVMNPSPEGGGYFMASIVNDKGQKRPKVHRLVAEEFIPNPDNLSFVNHKNFNRQDNRVANLEWCSRLANNRHAAENHRYLVKLRPEDILFIRKAIKDNTHRQIELAKKFNVHQSHINKIVKNTRRLITEYVS